MTRTTASLLLWSRMKSTFVAVGFVTHLDLKPDWSKESGASRLWFHWRWSSWWLCSSWRPGWPGIERRWHWTTSYDSNYRYFVRDATIIKLHDSVGLGEWIARWAELPKRPPMWVDIFIFGPKVSLPSIRCIRPITSKLVFGAID